MYYFDKTLIVVALFPILAGMKGCPPTGTPSGTYKVNTFRFVHAKAQTTADAPVPKVWIDTNLKLSSLSGGTYTSSLPCSVKIDYTDNSYTFHSAAFTSVKITYEDGAVDPSTEKLVLPIRITARDYEAVNSLGDGSIVKSKLWILSGEVPKVITRAQPFRLQMSGHFTKDDGSKLPFTIDQYFDIEKDHAVRSGAEVLQDK